jgi:hypothetical protein
MDHGTWGQHPKGRESLFRRGTSKAASAYEILVGILTDFFDTLGIGSFATTKPAIVGTKPAVVGTSSTMLRAAVRDTGQRAT